MTGTGYTRRIRRQQVLTSIHNAATGLVLGRYRILRPCGTGGMSTVYRALDLRTSTTVAVKVISTFQDQERVRREVEAIQAIDHPNVVKMLDKGPYRDGYVLVMEFVEGQTLRGLLGRDPGLTGQQAVSIAIEVLEGLAAAHRVGLVHRDIKPSNLMITDVERPAIRILDFGVVKQLGASRRITSVGTLLGTPTYMPPEQLLALSVDPSADVYSVGLVLWQMLTGVDPTQHGLDTLQGKTRLWHRLSSDAEQREPEGVFDVIAQMLHPDPHRRIPTAIVGAKRLRMALASSDAVPLPRAYDETQRLAAAHAGVAAVER
jgi:serine/threonine-protein kinase